MAVDLESICARVRADDRLPEPPDSDAGSGDGDYRAIGAEFLRHFVALGGLRPHEHVLDIGCGAGRMALPLAHYLAAEARYLGLDVVAESIAWCQHHVAPLHPNFAFVRLDIHHPLYNPAGRFRGDRVRLMGAQPGFDFVICCSLFTHLGADETARYLAEIGRLLKPGGRCFATFFLINADARDRLAENRTRYPFVLEGGGPVYSPPGDSVGGAVGVDEAWLRAQIAAAGLAPVSEPAYGTWPGRASGESYQDILVLAPAPSTAR